MMKRSVIIILIAVLAIALFVPRSWATEAMGVDIHGFISQGFLQTTDNNFIADSEDGSFEFNEVGINFGKDMTNRLRFSLQFFARDFGATDNSEITIDYAYGDYFFKNWLGLRFGQMKAPHGFYNETRDIDMLRNSIFLPQSVYEEMMRSPMLSLQGVGLYGHLDMRAVGGLSYQVMYGTQTISKNSRMAQALVGFPADYVENDTTEVKEKYAGSIVWATPLDGLRFGVSYDNTKMELTGHFNRSVMPPFLNQGDPLAIDFDEYSNWVYSAEYAWRNLMLVAEYIKVKREFIIDLYEQEDQYEPDGWYAGAAYRFTDWFELGAYYSEINGNRDESTILNVSTDYYDYLKDYCATMRFDINPYWVFKLEYHNFEGAYSLSAWDNPEATEGAMDYFEKDWTMFAAKMTVSF